MNIKILGILGGGQLGRMSAMAAAQLGIRTIIFCPEEDSPASHVAYKTINAPYDDKKALKTFSDATDIISYEFENIPVDTVDYLNSIKPNSVYPEKKLLEVSQDRIKEKSFLNEIGIETARWGEIKDISDIQHLLEQWRSQSFVLKTTRFGYDGKGQIFGSDQDLAGEGKIHEFLEKTKDQSIIMEDCVNFVDEISVVVARDKYAKMAVYGPMLNEHHNHILHKTTVPTPHNKEISVRAFQLTKNLAESVGLVGVLTLEFFVTRNGRLLANEIAPRTHNSGHWTIDGCAVSQFEQHVRTVCGLPVGSAARHSDVMMLNLIGDQVNDIEEYFHQKNACVHLYGKQDVREGRKMGHVTILEEKTDD